MKLFSMKSLWVTVLCAVGLSSCGANVHSKSIKDYRVSLTQGDASFVPLLKAIVNDYNSHAGIQAVQYVDSPDQANSRILVTQDLEKRDGKVGWGQWFSTSERSGTNLPGSTVDEVTEYSFQVEFDADFLRNNNKIDNGVVQYEVQKLFAHEVGHGFKMDHDPAPTNVMYYDITGVKDFNPYFERVRAFFNAP